MSEPIMCGICGGKLAFRHNRMTSEQVAKFGSHDPVIKLEPASEPMDEREDFKVSFEAFKEVLDKATSLEAANRELKEILNEKENLINAQEEELNEKEAEFASLRASIGGNMGACACKGTIEAIRSVHSSYECINMDHYVLRASVGGEKPEDAYSCKTIKAYR